MVTETVITPEYTVYRRLSPRKERGEADTSSPSERNYAKVHAHRFYFGGVATSVLATVYPLVER